MQDIAKWKSARFDKVVTKTHTGCPQLSTRYLMFLGRLVDEATNINPTSHYVTASHLLVPTPGAIWNMVSRYPYQEASSLV